MAKFKISPGLGRNFPGASAIAIATHMQKTRKEIKPAAEALRSGARRVLEVLEAAIAGYLRERQIHAFARLFTSRIFRAWFCGPIDASSGIARHIDATYQLTSANTGHFRAHGD